MATRNTFFMKVIILGDSKVGKSSLIDRYVKGIYSPIYRTTIGDDFLSKKIVMDNRLVIMQIWDTAGQEHFRELSRYFYHAAEACVLVYDVTDKASFWNLDTLRDEFILERSLRDRGKFQFVVVGNKVDLDGRQISTVEARKWCERKHIPYYETSAKDGINVEAVFEFLAGIARTHEDSDMVKLGKEEQEEVSNNQCSCIC